MAAFMARVTINRGTKGERRGKTGQKTPDDRLWIAETRGQTTK